MRVSGLYDPRFEHDACGVGFVGYLDGAPRHDVIDKGITILCNLAHRGAAGADSDSGDGAGIMLRVPDAFLRRNLECSLPDEGEYGLGMLFLPLDSGEVRQCRELVDRAVAASGWRVLAWREVPGDPEVLGQTAFISRPAVWLSPRQCYPKNQCRSHGWTLGHSPGQPAGHQPVSGVHRQGLSGPVRRRLRPGAQRTACGVQAH